MANPLADLLACPRCHGALHERDDVYSCALCGNVGRRTLGYPDFTPRTGSIDLAAGGVFDLDDDRDLAARMKHDGRSFAEMLDLTLENEASEQVERPHSAVERAAKRYERVEAEAGDRHGDAILDKIEAEIGRLVPSGPPPTVALEAGGGLGKYLYGFRHRFDHVVFVDCSLANVVFAEQLAREQGVDGVSFVRADVTELPFRAGLFDFVHQNGVIEHVADPVAMVRESRRVTRTDGVYACLSPNRYPITREPHFQVRLFGIYPPAIRRQVIRRTCGIATEAGTDLQSLRMLRRTFREAGVREPKPFFLPPRLPSIARNTPVRRAIQAMLDMPPMSRWLRALLNGPALPVMPYHLVVTTGGVD